MAIAFDYANTSYSNVTDDFTHAHTCSGSDRILLAIISTNSGADSVTGVTYNGVAMTRKSIWSAAGAPVYLYYLIAPATGTNNMVVALDRGTNSCLVGTASYTGVLQSANAVRELDLSLLATRTSLTKTITPTWSKSWAIIMGQQFASTAASFTTTSGTERADQNYSWIADSNGIITAPQLLNGNVTSTTTTCAGFELLATDSVSKELYTTPLFSDANLKYYWRLNGNSNSTVGSNNGTDTNVTYSDANGVFGNGAGFAATGDIELPTKFSGTAGTIAFWFKTPTNTGQTLFQQSRSYDDTRFSIAMSNVSVPGEITFWVNNGGSALIQFRTNATTFGDGYPHWLCLVGGTGGNALYVDGSAVGLTYTTGNSSTTAWLDSISSEDRCTIGTAKYNSAVVSRYNGGIDEFAYFDRKLTPTEIGNWWNGTLPSTATGNMFLMFN